MTKGKQIAITHTPVNYTSTWPQLEEHMAGMDNALTWGGGVKTSSALWDVDINPNFSDVYTALQINAITTPLTITVWGSSTNGFIDTWYAGSGPAGYYPNMWLITFVGSKKDDLHNIVVNDWVTMDNIPNLNDIKMTFFTTAYCVVNPSISNFSLYNKAAIAIVHDCKFIQLDNGYLVINLYDSVALWYGGVWSLIDCINASELHINLFDQDNIIVYAGWLYDDWTGILHVQLWLNDVLATTDFTNFAWTKTVVPYPWWGSGSVAGPVYVWNATDSFSTFYTANNFSSLNNKVTVYVNTGLSSWYSIDNRGSMYTNMWHITFVWNNQTDSPNWESYIQIQDWVTMDNPPHLDWCDLDILTTDYCIVDPVAHSWYITNNSGVSMSIAGCKFINLVSWALWIKLWYWANINGDASCQLVYIGSTEYLTIDELDTNAFIDPNLLYWASDMWWMNYNQYFGSVTVIPESFVNLPVIPTVVQWNIYALQVFTDVIDTPEIAGNLEIWQGNLININANADFNCNSIITDTRTTSNSKTTWLMLQEGADATSWIAIRRSPAISMLSKAWNTTASKINTLNLQVVPTSAAITTARLWVFNETVNGAWSATELIAFWTDSKIKINWASFIYPSANSTSSLVFSKADWTTQVMKLDTTNGRVWINLLAGSNPTATLDVNGNVKVSNATSATVWNIVMGTSLMFANSHQSVYLWFQTGNYTTTGNNNFWIGAWGLTHITNGWYNFAWGSNCLGTLTTGNYNVALWSNVLLSLQSGDNNIAIWKQCMVDTIVSNNNIAIWYNSLSAAGTFLSTASFWDNGSWLIRVTSDRLVPLVDWNTVYIINTWVYDWTYTVSIISPYVFDLNSSSYTVDTIGNYYSLEFTGDNIAIWNSVLNVLAQGLHNVAIWSQAGGSKVFWSNSTSIWYYSGGQDNDNNVCIGYYAGSYETGSKKLFIDWIDRGTEVTWQTDSIIYWVMDELPTNQILTINWHLYVSQVKRWATQVAAWANVWEVRRTASHLTLPDWVLMIWL